MATRSSGALNPLSVAGAKDFASAARRRSMAHLGRRVLAVGAGAWLLVTALFAAATGYGLLRALVLDGSLGTVLVVALGAALALGYLSYRSGSQRLLGRLGATPLSTTAASGVHASLDRLATRMAIDAPALYVARLGQPNAFALGRDTLVVDRSLLRLLGPAELEAILAHELAHLAGRDTLVQTLANSLLRTVTGLALVVFAPFVAVFGVACWGLSLLLGRPVRGAGSVASGPRRAAMRLLVGLVTGPTVALRAYSRRREYAADERAVEVLDDPLALARALRTIQRATEPGFGLFAWLFGDVERERSPLERTFATHPPTDDRIERVREAARARGAGSGRGRIEIN